MSVGQFVRLDPDWDEIRARFSRQVRKDTNDFERKRGFSCRSSNSIEDFDYFYERMLVPYATSRFGKYSASMPREKVRSIFDKGFLLLIEKDGVVVAGQLAYESGGVLHANRLGILDGDPQYVKCGAAMAAYFYSLRVAMQRGCVELSLGGSLPFLNNGVLRHKAEWGATFVDSDRDSDCFSVFASDDPARARPFFAYCPTVVMERGQFRVLAASAGGDGLRAPIGEDDLERWRKLGLTGGWIFTEEGCYKYSFGPGQPPTAAHDRGEA